MTTNNKAFEKHCINTYGANSNQLHLLSGRDLQIAYKSATTEANKRIAELDSEVADLNDAKKDYEIEIEHWKDIAENLVRSGLKNSGLQASNNHLREALEKVKAQNDKYIKDGRIDHIVCNALSATPAESLQAHDDEILERASKAADKARWLGTDVVLAIRALKEVK